MPETGKRINPRAIFSRVWIPPSVFDSTDLSPTAKLCFGRLASMCGEKDYCWPSQETLAEELKVTSRSVRECLSQLEDSGFIETEQVGLRKTNRYWIKWPQVLEDDLTDPDRKKTSGQDRKKTSGQDRKETSAPSVISSGELVQGNNTSLPSTENQPQQNLNLEDDVLTFVQNAYSRENRRAKLDNLRARANNHTCELICRAEKEHGAAAFRGALLTYLANDNEKVVSARWPIMWFLTKIDWYLPHDGPVARPAPVPASAGPSEDVQRPTTIATTPAASNPILPDEADVWNEIVTAGVKVTDFNWDMEEGRDLRRCREQVKFTAATWRTICERAQKAIENECGWVTFRWLLKNDNNWWKTLQGEYDNYKPKTKKLGKPDPFAKIRKELGIA